MEDVKIIELLWNRDQQALKEITIKYEKLCIEVANNILGNIRDAEEIVNEVYLAVWNSIPPKKPEYLKAYICKIVKNLATSDYLRTLNNRQRDLFIGRYWFNYSIKALATKCNVSESNIKTSLHRTRSGLKKYLEKKGVEL